MSKLEEPTYTAPSMQMSLACRICGWYSKISTRLQQARVKAPGRQLGNQHVGFAARISSTRPRAGDAHQSGAGGGWQKIGLMISTRGRG